MRISGHKIILFLLFTTLYASAQTVNEVKTLYEKKEYTKVLEMVPKAMKLKPKDANLNLYKALSLYELGDKSKSEADFAIASKANLAPAFYYLGTMEYYSYQFEKSVADLTKYIAHPKCDTLLKAKAQKLLKYAEVAYRLMKGVEKVQIIDSVIVDKANFVNEYHLSPEAGSVQSSRSVFQHDTTSFTSLFQNQRGDRLIFARKTDDHGLDLFSKSRLIEKWSERTNLGDVVNSEFDENYPFMLSDGVTLYFSSNRPGSMGGHDIFVTRYNLNNDSYLTPENVGVPFNSIYNDYLLALDEINNVGWFASDRFQPEGKVVVYLFIPNEEKQNVTNVSAQRLIQLATLQSIKLTWQKGANYAPILEKIHQMKTDSVSSESDFNQIRFVVNNNLVYRSLSQFKSNEAREKFLQLQTADSDLYLFEGQLNRYRFEYGKADKEKRRELSRLIIPLEAKIDAARSKVYDLTINIRQLESLTLK